MILLRADQQHAVEDLRAAYRAGFKAPLLVAPTGFGKTVVFSYITAHARGRVLILVHRQELLDQVSATLEAFNVPHSFLSPGKPRDDDAKVILGSVQTVVRRLPRAAIDLLVIDEAHHAIPASSWGKVIAALGHARLLGVTATPCRLSGEGLSPPFDTLIQGPTVTDLIRLGHLAAFRVFAPPTIDASAIPHRMGDFTAAGLAAAVDKPRITGDAVEHYQRLAAGKRAVVFCVSVQHAQHVAQEFCKAGYEGVALDGKLDKQCRRRHIADFHAGNIQILTSCDLISEGFDCPGIEVGISLRPTESVGLWLQQVGRCLRPGKPAAIILDHAGNTLRHGLPSEPRQWSLTGVRQSRQRAVVPATGPNVRVCQRCFAAQSSEQRACQHCGEVFLIKARKVAQRAGELRELSAEQLRGAQQARQARQEVGMTGSLEGLIAIGRQRRYRNPEAWARYVVAGRAKRGRR